MTNEQRAMDEINLKSILGRDIAIGWSTDKLLYIDLGPGSCVAICGVELLKFMEWLRSAPPPSESEYSQTRDRMSTGCTHHGDEPIGQAGSTPAGRTESPPRDPAALGTPTDNKTTQSGPVLSEVEIAAEQGRELPDEPGLWIRGNEWADIGKRSDGRLSAEAYKLLPKLRHTLGWFDVDCHDFPHGNWHKAQPDEAVKLRKEVERLKQQCEDADLLLGNAWQDVVDIARGDAGIEVALRTQCTKLTGDIVELEDQLTRLRTELTRADKEADDLDTALRELCEPVIGFDGAWGKSGVNADPIPGIEGVVEATIAKLEAQVKELKQR